MTDDIVYAAGGIVWKRESGENKVALKYRNRYGGQWALPKGKLLDEDSWKSAAMREVEQEIGGKVYILDHADSVHYLEDGNPKVVSFWHMKLSDEKAKSVNGEYDDIGWFTPSVAIEKLGYEAEKKVLDRIEFPEKKYRGGFTGFLQETYRRLKVGFNGKSRYDRLKGDLETFRDEFESLRVEKNIPADRASKIDKMLIRSEGELFQGNVDIAWKIFLGAKRLYLLDLSREELKEEIKLIRTEAEKLSDWRRRAIYQLVGDSEHPRKDFEVTPELLVKATRIRDEYYSDEYYKNKLLRSVYLILLPVMAALVFLAWRFFRGNDFADSLTTGAAGVLVENLATMSWGVILFGMLGGCISAIFRVRDSSQITRIPEIVSHHFVTGIRVLTGGALAFIVFVFLQSDFANQIFAFSADPATAFTFFAISFVAGFSERLVLRAINTVVGEDKNGD